MKTLRLALHAALLVIANRMLQFALKGLVPTPPPVKQAPQIGAVLGLCESCGEAVIDGSPHTYMDHVSRPAHADCVVFCAPDEMN